MTETPFRIDIPDAVLEDLRDRLARTRWSDQVEDAGWDYGVDLDYLRELCDYWQHTFDWRAAETRLNEAGEHTKVRVGDLDIHVQRRRSSNPDATVLVLLHGWPDSFWRFSKLLPLLEDFDVVVPSLPGYGFSSRPTERGFSSWRMAETLLELLRTLGIQRYVVHGGDIGSSVGEAMAEQAPDTLLGLHLTDVPYRHMFTVDRSDLSDAEQDYLDRGRTWQQTEGAYALLQSTKPQTAAAGLNDSPAGLAAWIVEKFRTWSDCGGDIESRFTKDELLTNLTLYWATQTIGSSFRVYYERPDTQPRATQIDVPTGVAIFPKDLVPAPREFGERFFDVWQWTVMSRGGHFAALEEPQLLADDLTAFVAGLDRSEANRTS